MKGATDPLFEFWLFTTDTLFAQSCIEGGITGIFIDWEYIGKDQRQEGARLECNHDSLEDLIRMRKAVQAKIICRINAFGPHTPEEVEMALSGGADVIMLPMVRNPAEVEAFLSSLDGRTECGILVETTHAISHASELSSLPLDYVYVGLNDLALSRGSHNIFRAISDGTVEQLRSTFSGTKFGFGGITLLDRGSPLPFPLLLREMVALDCNFSFLRRSFKSDIPGRNISFEINRIKQAMREYRQRSLAEIQHDRQELFRIIESIDHEPT